MVKRTIPDAGDIVELEFKPNEGHEQGGRRPALVVSPREFNRATGLIWAVPITTRDRAGPLEAALEGAKRITGVARLAHIRAFDFRARAYALLDRISPEQTADIRARMAAVLTPEP